MHRTQYEDQLSLEYHVESSPWAIPGEQDCARASVALACVAGWGVRTDGSRVEAWAAELDEEMDRTRAVLLGDADGIRHAIAHADAINLNGYRSPGKQPIELFLELEEKPEGLD